MWSEISESLASRKYEQMKDVITDFESEINIFSLNIRHLYDKISKLRDGIDYYQKFDFLCFNECNLKLEKIPNAIEDILLEGFQEPILQPPARSSGRGGGLAIYVNNRIYEETDINSKFNLNPEPDNVNGEFQFIKIKIFKRSNRTATFGNVYRSPSRNAEKFNMLLANVLQKLHWYTKKKLLYLVGDFNQDIFKYNTDTNSQNLIDMCSNHGLVQLVSRPTRIPIAPPP